MPTGKAALFMALLLGAALAGSGVMDGPTGVHSTCEDGLDNDGDSFIDVGDLECTAYPWADGSGEKTTTVGVTVGENGRLSGSGEYQSSAFAYWLAHLQSDPAYAPPDYCDLAQNGYVALGSSWDDSYTEALAFKNDPANGCPP